MNSQKELFHLLTDKNLSYSERAQLRCQLARQYEDQGDYEAARGAMGELWQRVGQRPMLDQLDEETKAIVLLRAGVLTGWIGSARQISRAQEAAKNLLSESITIFEALQQNSRVAEAQIDLAYCYWREGALDEGRIWLREAVKRLSKSEIELRAKASLRSAIIERTANRNSDALKILTEAVLLFEQVGNHCLRGSFHNQFANVLENLSAAENREDYIDKALIEYTAASHHFGEVGHLRYQACVENNLAFLFFKIQKFAEAHRHLDHAEKLFVRLKDDLHRAQLDETRARLLLAEDRVSEAVKAASRSVRSLETGDEPSLLAEALTTLGISLTRLRHFEQARSALAHAIENAQQTANVEIARKPALALLEQLDSQLSKEDLAAVARAKALLEKTQDMSTILWLADSACHLLSVIQISPTFPPSLARGISFDDEIERYGKHLIALALKHCDGSVTNAARMLDLSHQNLAAKIARYELTDLRKPVRQRSRNINDTSEPTSSLQIEECKTPRSVTILLVERNDMVARAVTETLETKSWAVETCSDGTVALDTIAGASHYDLLLIGYDLPGINGIELVQHARTLVHRSRTPIIVFSGTPVEAAARAAGADEFLQKPEGLSSLADIIGRFLNNNEQEKGGD